MSLKERMLKKGTKLLESSAVQKLVFAYKMGSSSDYRGRWLEGHLTGDVARGAITVEQSERILKQSQNPQTSRHFGESFTIPLVSYGVAGISSACIAYYAWESNDPLAWGYTLSHFAQGLPKISISSVTRATLLAASIGYDHVQDRQIGSLKRIAGELAVVSLSAVSWVGSGNAGPAMRVGLTSPELGAYLSARIFNKEKSDKQPVIVPQRKDSAPHLYYRTLTALG